jgi:hypothetical protein
MIRVSCPGCGKKLVIKPELAGRLVLCPSCKSKLRVPAAEAVQESEAKPETESAPPKRPTSAISAAGPKPEPRRPTTDDDEDQDEEEERPRKRRRKRKRRRSSSGSTFAGIDPFFIIVGAAALVALISVGIGLAFPPALPLAQMVTSSLTLVGGIWIVVLAFMEDSTQGILCFCCFPYMIYWAISHFDEAKLPACLYAIGFVLNWVTFGMMYAMAKN